MQRAAFLDRDGVINIDHAYVYRWEEFEFVEGVFEAAKKLVDAGFVLVIVTNQSGIGRGYYTEADFHALDQKVREAFANAGAPVAG
ncbi:MAG: HAD-IIIA family hydrolase, partial [Sutterellaceae bacterium]|nr:HAD-IIIA family hydrolase [Sutterellaceae bacterium]